MNSTISTGMYWPLSIDGKLPESLFSKNILHTTFMADLPRALNCSQVAVRRAFKNLVKKEAPAIWRSDAPSDESERSAWLIATSCNTHLLRSQLKSLTIIEQAAGGRRTKPRVVGWPLGELLWHSYKKSEKLEELHKWITVRLVKHDADPRLKVLTASIVSHPDFHEKVPGGMNSTDLARIIVTLASRLPKQEMGELLQESFARGCAPLSEFLDQENRVEDLESNEKDSTERNAIGLPLLCPPVRYEPENSRENAEFLLSLAQASAQANQKAASLDAALTQMPSAASWIETPQSRIDYIFSQIQAARDSYAVVSEYDANVQKRNANNLEEIERAIGRPLNIRKTDGVSADEAIEILKATSELHRLLLDEKLPLSIDQGMQEDSSLPMDAQSILTVCREIFLHRKWRDSADQYVVELATHLGPKCYQAGDILPKLSGIELAALARACAQSKWIPASAAFIRLALEKDAGRAAAALTSILCDSSSTQERRSLLYFISPDQISLLSGKHAKRISALEYIRDALEFGPIARLASPHSWLRDTSIVGRFGAEVIEVIVNNSDRLENLDAISRLLAPATSKQKNKAFRDYVEMPIGMQGNYRRLREIARESVLLPIMNEGDISRSRAIELDKRLSSNDLIEEIVFELDQERAGVLEARHRENLRRYIERARLLLGAHISEKSSGDQREKDIRRALTRSIAKLPRPGSESNASWFECELRDMIQSPKQAATYQTLQGSTAPLSSLEWTGMHTDWALAAGADLPILRKKTGASMAGFLGESLFYRSKSSPPSAQEIVEQLIYDAEFNSALAYCRSEAPELENMLAAAAEPETTVLYSKAAEIRAEFGAAAVESSTDFSTFEYSIQQMDFLQARESLELIELSLTESRELKSRSERDQLEATLLIERLQSSGVLQLQSTELSYLKDQWQHVLTTRKGERTHLECLRAPLSEICQRLPELVRVAEENETNALDPKYWIPDSASSDFEYVAKETIEKLRYWSESADFMKPEERRALSLLIESFVRYLSERTLGLGQSNDQSATSGALDRLVEVMDCITSSSSPAAALETVRVLGEFGSMFSGQHDEKESPGTIRQNESEVRNFSSVPEAISRLVLNEQWLEAIRSCDDWKHRVQPSDAAVLNAIASACKVFANECLRPSDQNIHAAISMISSRSIGPHQFTPETRIALAQILLARAMTLDGVEDSGSDPSLKSWSAIINHKGSPLRRGSFGEGHGNRCLNELISGLAGHGIASTIWDAAAGSSEAAVLRGGLLTKLSELDLNDSIIRLAARTEGSLGSKLGQLFELRGVALGRPELIPVSQALTEQIMATTKSSPFKSFLKSLPIAASPIQPSIDLKVDEDVVIRGNGPMTLQGTIPVIVTPIGFVTSRIEATLLADDDVAFAGGGIRLELSSKPIYIPTEFDLRLNFGKSWAGSRSERRSLRIRVRALSVTGDRASADIEIGVRQQSRTHEPSGFLDNDTLLDAYPGVSNTPAVDTTFIGRIEELELLHKLLVTARNPSPVLLVGLRRIGKTSLIYEFHKRLKAMQSRGSYSLYVSLAERRTDLAGNRHSVSEVVFNAIARSIVRPHVAASDQNYYICHRVRDAFNGDWQSAREKIRSCFDPDSLSDSLSALRELLGNFIGAGDSRLVILVDEAEALVAAYNASETKRLELEQLLQSIREVSQRDATIALLLAGSNHINVFAREYKNAFFGSSQVIELGGLPIQYASALVAPGRVAPFVSFDSLSIEYSHEICAGMPQFMWQLGATAAHLIRSGPVTRSDIRRAVAVLTSHESSTLPFKSYDALEPVDSVIALEGDRERDLLWMLLYKIAQSSSLIVEEAAIAFAIDQSLLQIDERDNWKRRVSRLAELGLLRFPSATTVAFEVPMFAEAFRAGRNWQEFSIREQKVTR